METSQEFCKYKKDLTFWKPAKNSVYKKDLTF